MQKKKILIVEDDKELVKLITFHMTIAGYEALSAKDGIEALEVCKLNRPDLVILDIMLPRIDGWEVCRRLRQDSKTSNIPIIILSALSDINDKLKGFDLGSDDYVTKPFSPRELVVRVKRVLARSESRSSLPKIIRASSLEINLEDMTVKRDNQEILLTEKEKGILKFFVNNPGRLLTHSEILDEVWGEDNIVEYGNIDVHISHLREKLEKDPENPQLIKTVKGEGYRFEP
jgi:two-component system alkaline phosphatase synthesis response regulator PhoP